MFHIDSESFTKFQNYMNFHLVTTDPALSD